MAHQTGHHILLDQKNQGNTLPTPPLPWLPKPKDRESIDRTQYPLLGCTNSIRLLWNLGVNHLSELISANGRHVISTTDLHTRFGARTKSKHKRALNTITTTLTQCPNTPQHKSPEGTHAKTLSDRTIHPDYTTWVRSLRNNTTCVPTPIYALLHQAKRAPSIPEDEKIHIDLTHKKRKIIGTSSLQIILPEPRPLIDPPLMPPMDKSYPQSSNTNPSTATRWERAYNQLRALQAGLTHKSHEKRMAGLNHIYNNLSTREDPIAQVTAHRRAKTTEDGKNAVQHQYLTTWMPTPAQRW